MSSVGKRSLKLNQEGSTLLMVLICLAFLGILGSLILSVSLVNLQMKKVEINSKKNFYTCEKALSEIRAGLEELTATKIRENYQTVLENYIIYAALSEEMRSTSIQNKIVSSMVFTLGSDAAAIESRMTSYLSEKEDYVIHVNAVTPYMVGDKYLLFKDVEIQYTKAGYETKITTDIRITLPSFIFEETGDSVTYSMKQPFEGYALVADGAISSEHSSGENYITGNLYAGGNILIRDSGVSSSHKVFLDGTYITTRGSILLEDTASLFIGNGGGRPLVWARNILTANTNAYLPVYSSETKLTMNAICLVQDDLTLDARNSKAVLSGAYIGYTGGITAAGSAMIVNGAASSMDLSGLSSLVLAGRAHVCVEDSILKITNPTLADVNIMTGESLGMKSNQRAYLVPGEYIFLEKDASSLASNHNPITKKDLLDGTPRIRITAPSDTGKLDLTDDYLNETKPYKIAAKQTISGEISTLRYYFLNFVSGKRADQYLRDYMGKYPNALQTANRFSYKGIKPPAAEHIKSAGNIMYYDTDDATSPVKYIPGISGSYSSDSDVDTAIAGLGFNGLGDGSLFQGTVLKDRKLKELKSLYFNMTHYLTSNPSSRTYAEADRVVESTVLRSGVEQVQFEYSAGYALKSEDFTYYSTLPATNSPLENTTDRSRKSILVLDGDVSIAASCYFNGILITTGNVSIGQGAVINGMVIAAGTEAEPGDVALQNNVKVNGRIIASGDISLGTDCSIDCTGATSLDAGEASEQFLENIFKADVELLWKMFMKPDATVHLSESGRVSDLVDLGNLVTTENWRKN